MIEFPFPATLRRTNWQDTSDCIRSWYEEMPQ